MGKVKDLGMTLTEEWSTDNTLNTTVDVADKLLPGLKVTLDTAFSPSTDSKSGKLKTEYKHEAATVTAVIDHKCWLAGYQTCFDITKSAVTKNNFGLGYTAQDFVLHTSVVNGTDFGGSVYQKVSPALETGVSLGWSSASAATTFGIGAKYVLPDGAAVR